MVVETGCIAWRQWCKVLHVAYVEFGLRLEDTLQAVHNIQQSFACSSQLCGRSVRQLQLYCQLYLDILKSTVHALTIL